MRFVKYHGLGNDFIVLSGEEAAAAPFTPAFARALCARGDGIGADGLMRVGRPAPGVDAHISMELLNSDGSLPEMCGNGIRCLVKYAVDELGWADNPLRVATEGGVRVCHFTRGPDGDVASVRVEMGAPSFDRARVPILGDGDAVQVAVQVDGAIFDATGVNTGNPHMVIFGDASRATAERWGPALTAHALWPEGANVEFAEVVGPSRLRVTVWERGCGLTRACGTGATATAAAAIRRGLIAGGEPAVVSLPGGDLTITVASDFSTAWMDGPAVEVYRGTVDARFLAAAPR